VLHLVAFGDDASALIAEDTDGFAAQEAIARPLCVNVEAIAVEMTDGGWKRHGRARPLAS
jgi:hypothetical protein